MPRYNRSWIRRGACAVALMATTACSPVFQNHGYIPTELQLAEVQVGVDTRESVIELIGTPTSGGVLGFDGYYYVQSRFRHFGFFAPEEIEREVLAVYFTPTGVVSNIERYGLEDGQVVVLNRRVTDDNIRDTTFIRQLLGNIGNFDAGTVLGAPGGP